MAHTRKTLKGRLKEAARKPVAGGGGRIVTAKRSLAPAPLDPAKFRDPQFTAKGEARAAVSLSGLRTLWFNTGTLCNLTCANCYIESSPRNDALVYISADEVAGYLDEAQALPQPVEEVGFTGGEPFMNPGMLPMLQDVMRRGLPALVLTNAMRPMMRHQARLAELNQEFPWVADDPRQPGPLRPRPARPGARARHVRQDGSGPGLVVAQRVPRACRRPRGLQRRNRRRPARGLRPAVRRARTLRWTPPIPWR